jgi:hypothetical protein
MGFNIFLSLITLCQLIKSTMHCEFKWLFRLFLLIVLVSGCGKERSYEPPTAPPVTAPDGTSGGSAEFTFEATAGNCSNTVATGIYEAGTVLTGDATITFTVNVTKIGDWTMSTNSLNGIIFLGAGTFTATGSQKITLIATGKPVAAGTNTFSLKAGTVTCSIAILTLPADAGTGGGTTSDYYYKITIDGITYQQAVTDNNNYEPGSGLGGGDDVTISASINYGESDPPAGTTSFGVTVGTMHNYMNATNDDFKAYFAPGTRAYTKDFSVADGIQLGWGDANGEEWGTDYGTGDQTGSTFTIVSVVGAPDLTGTYYLKTKMQFKCKLYNKTTGAVKEITNGEMVGSFGKI